MDFKKTSIRLDFDIAREASAILKTKTLAGTVNEALRETVDRHTRKKFFQRLLKNEDFDWKVLDKAWGGDH